MKVFPRLEFNDLISKFSADRVVRSGRSVIPNRIGGVGSHKIMNTFNDVTLNMLVSKSINTLNSKNEQKDGAIPTVSTVSTSSFKTQESRVSDDGKFSTPVATMLDNKNEADVSAEANEALKDTVIRIGKKV